MLTSLALIFLTGLSLAAIFGKLKLPRLVGMLLTGILLGISFLLLSIEGWLEGTLAVSGLLAIMSMAMIYAMQTKQML